MRDQVGNAGANPKGVVGVVDEDRFNRVTAGSQGEHRYDVIGEQVQDNDVRLLTQRSQFARLFQVF
jgi:hypothetical protein